MHGGGYRVDSRKEASALSVMPYVQMGWNAVNVEYRAQRHRARAGGRRGRAVRAPVGHPQREGIQRRHRAHRRDGPIRRVAPGVDDWPGAESAGFDRNCPGPEPLKVAAVVSWYGVFDYTTLVDDPKRDYAITWIGGQPNYKDVATRVSPMTYVRAGLPPVIAIHGDADPIVPYEQEVREIDALKKAGGVAELVTIPGGGHGNFPRDQVLRAWTAIDAFLQTNVVNKKPVSTSAARAGLGDSGMRTGDPRADQHSSITRDSPNPRFRSSARHSRTGPRSRVAES